MRELDEKTFRVWHKQGDSHLEDDCHLMISAGGLLPDPRFRKSAI